MSRKQVLHVVWDGDLGGVQRLLLKLLSNESWGPFTHSICFFGSCGRIINSKTLPGVPICSLNLRRGIQFFRARRLRRVIEEIRPDVVHVHCDSPAFLQQAYSFRGIPMVYHEHGDSLMRDKNQLILKLLWMCNKNAFSHIISISDFVTSQFRALRPTNSSPLTVLHNPLTEEATERKIFPSSKRLQVGYMGRLAHQKGADRMVDLARLCHNQPIDFHIYGDGELKCLLESASAGSNLIVHGYTDSPVGRLQELDLLVVPSRIEPFGLVALEALAVGVPVAGFRNSGVEEIVTDGETGLLYSPGDLSALSNDLMDPSLTRQKLQEMGRSGSALVKDKFSLSKYVDSIKLIYSDVIAINR